MLSGKLFFHLAILVKFVFFSFKKNIFTKLKTLLCFFVPLELKTQRQILNEFLKKKQKKQEMMIPFKLMEKNLR